MSFLSNVELKSVQASAHPLIVGIDPKFLHAGADGPLEACAIKLRVGDIYLAPQSSLASVAPEQQVILQQGEMAFVLTKEEVSLPSDIGGIMFPKSGGIADRGILITNAGHVDPGYKGKLRYAVINMGNKPFPLRSGDYLVKVLFFKLNSHASPVWSELHQPLETPTSSALSSLGREFAAIEKRMSDIAIRRVNEYFLKLGLTTLFFSVTASVILAVFAATTASGFFSK